MSNTGPSSKYEMFDNLFKVCILGKVSVGKSCLCCRFTGLGFPKGKLSTIGASYMTTKISIAGGKIIKLEIWDTAGQERFKSLAPMYYRGAQGIFVVYDVGDKRSWDEAKDYIATVKEKVSEPEKVTIVAVGNKLDLVSESGSQTFEGEVKKWISEHSDILWVEASARTGINIDLCVKALLSGTSSYGGSRSGASKGNSVEMDERDLVEMQKKMEKEVVWTFDDVNPEECSRKGLGLLGKNSGRTGSSQWDSGYYKNPFGADGTSGSESVKVDGNDEVEHSTQNGCRC